MENREMTLEESFAIGEMDQFYKKTMEKVAATVRGKKFAGMEPDDVIQEAVIKVHRAIPKYDSSKARIGTFIDTIISNQIKDCFKRAGSIANLSVVNADSLSVPAIPTIFFFEGAEDATLEVGTTDVGYQQFEVVSDLMDNIGLTEREKEVFKLRSAGYEYFEIAEALKISRTRVSQIKDKIQEKYRNATAEE